MDDLLIIEEKIDLEVRSLETCMYDHKTFSEILNRVQKAVDDLNLHSYSNLPIWVNKLDMEVHGAFQALSISAGSVAVVCLESIFLRYLLGMSRSSRVPQLMPQPHAVAPAPGSSQQGVGVQRRAPPFAEYLTGSCWSFPPVHLF